MCAFLSFESQLPNTFKKYKAAFTLAENKLLFYHICTQMEFDAYVLTQHSHEIRFFRIQSEPLPTVSFQI